MSRPKDGKGRMLDFEDMRTILFYSEVKGYSGPRMEEATNISATTCNALVNMNYCAKNGDWDGVLDAFKKSHSKRMLRFIVSEYPNPPDDFWKKADEIEAERYRKRVEARNKDAHSAAQDDAHSAGQDNVQICGNDFNDETIDKIVELIKNNNWLLANQYNTRNHQIIQFTEMLNKAEEIIPKKSDLNDVISINLDVAVEKIIKCINSNFDVFLTEQRKMNNELLNCLRRKIGGMK